ncbi:uncharacterized protein KY384_004362 [Bacidia gigantensis]|uniref:uncharacterized protein n=1 Tax=Bacidia gigantensis TaxID=2732470 RepID=UPI001D03FD39|nr:uncharacterized protein KY384_004362 [Bacidia gigantensis]KAG8531005.1 hypothetical protein KY384_004362 [Bacidia gigantensis]
MTQWLSHLFIPLVLLQLCLSSTAQIPPVGTFETDVTTVRSPVDPRIAIRFKSPPIGTCTTVFSTQRQYAGYVSIPPFVLAPIQQNYSINTFFWFIEARTNASSSPLTIYINGGPGSSSMVGLFQETGPCEVVELTRGRFGTRARDWGWDRSSNVLYVDQPNQVGFSYDILKNGSLDLFTSNIRQSPAEAPSTSSIPTVLNGTFASNDQNGTANTTEIAAHAVWHMLQGFLSAFPQYNPAPPTTNRTQPGAAAINLFTESYGGKYGPTFASVWQQQNGARKNGSFTSNKSIEIQLSSLGIMQGCVDDLVQGSSYPIFANNNTYGIKALSLVDQQTAASSYLSVGGCQQLIEECRGVVNASDPNNDGDVSAVNQACRDAQDTCQRTVVAPFASSGRNPYDITQKLLDPFPPSTYLEYLNDADVQAAVGVPLNYTQNSDAVAQAFQATGDVERGETIQQLANLLSRGVKVALVYGDRDYLCNWFGGEAVSFAVAARLPAYAPFYSAGYADIVVNNSYVGGAVRQFGNLSFSRIYSAGHLIPAYQPETAFTVFTRIIMGSDISFGKEVDLSSYKSNGTANATYTAKPPGQTDPICWIRDIQAKCTDDQQQKLRDGEGVIINGILYDKESDWKAPPSSMSVQAGFPGQAPAPPNPTVPPSSSKGNDGAMSTPTVPTGVYTATATPSPSKSRASALHIHFVTPFTPTMLYIACLLGHCIL